MTGDPKFSPAGWRYRGVALTKGNSTPLGCLFLAVINRPATFPPWFGDGALITPEGFVVTSLVDKSGRVHHGHSIGPVEEVRDSFRKIAEAIHATDAETLEIMDELRRWIKEDKRGLTDPNADG